MRYIRPTSLTWWAGLASIATGVALMAVPDSFALTEVGTLLVMLGGSGDASPASLIYLGLGMIGLRDVIERRVAT